jgi:hypothetical protein
MTSALFAADFSLRYSRLGIVECCRVVEDAVDRRLAFLQDAQGLAFDRLRRFAANRGVSIFADGFVQRPFYRACLGSGDGRFRL